MERSSVEKAAATPNPTPGENKNKNTTSNSKKQRPGPCGWLREHRVSLLTRHKRRLVEVPYTATIADTANALQANCVSAMAVAAPPGRWIGAGGTMILESDPATGAVRKHYIGMVTMLDILVHIAEAGVKGGGKWEEMDLNQSMMVPVSSVIGHSLEGLSLWTLNPNTSIMDCMETFSKGVHRALVPIGSQTDNSLPVELVESSPGYKMVTQMDVIRFLQESSHELKDILSSSIQALDAINENVFAVAKNTKVDEVIKTMRAASLTAVPVVDADGVELLQDGRGKRVVETFSASDLRDCPMAQLQSWLGLTVTEFKEKVGALKATLTPEGGTAISDVQQSPKLITSFPENSLKEVIEMVVVNHVHRVWVVDRQSLLLGLVSLTDILRAVRESALKMDQDMQGIVSQ
ncbi:SNF1-related protein kinase regulatory subunit gamma-like PV42a [Rhynchospora pubera]|uniref:SNF1-related protein kinase regulatory subunit gamma-like PV42a n=1 Tax=Rhynchospora pubera TaxID=906938 RepID=A0AAV8HEY9_9POAL|nr:SNF1-related protein kinase regulatory subunit gamma-like PV42a [Rhynchospora pubera]